MSDAITSTPAAVRAAEGALRSLSNHEPAGVALRVRENGGDLLAYKRLRDAERADALREMAEEAQRLGLGT